ncbi:hypothetical protein NN561_019549 [Cricetulus griseus]
MALGFRVGSRQQKLGRGELGSGLRGGPGARGGDAPARGGSWRHRQEEARRGERKEAGPQPTLPTRHRILPERGSLPLNRLLTMCRRRASLEPGNECTGVSGTAD